jgi:hypothetical protein
MSSLPAWTLSSTQASPTAAKLFSQFVEQIRRPDLVAFPHQMQVT